MTASNLLMLNAINKSVSGIREQYYHYGKPTITKNLNHSTFEQSFIAVSYCRGCDMMPKSQNDPVVHERRSDDTENLESFIKDRASVGEDVPAATPY